MVQYDNAGWLYEPLTNDYHDITIDDINDLIKLNAQDQKFREATCLEAAHRVKHPSQGTGFMLDRIVMQNAGGTTVGYPYAYGMSVLFPHGQHLFRGENTVYAQSLPTLNRKIASFNNVIDKELYRSIANMRCYHFIDLCLKINVVPFWEATICDVNFKALAQHYGFETSLLDLTGNFLVALFFATCKYDVDIGDYRPLTQKEIDLNEKTRYGVIFHSPIWYYDYLQHGMTMATTLLDGYRQRQMPTQIDDERLNKIVFQIGYQPFYRCSYQDGYVMSLHNDHPLQNDTYFEKLRFKQSEELSQKVFSMLHRGRDVFPHEGIEGLLPLIQQIQQGLTFSFDELKDVYETEVSHRIFGSFSDYKSALANFIVGGHKVEIVNEPIIYDIPTDLLNDINSVYDNEDLIQRIGGVIYSTPEQRKYRAKRSIELYGKVL